MTFRQLVTPSPLIRSKEYMGKTGYTNYDMYLPKAENNKYAFAALEGGKNLEYNEAKHLKIFIRGSRFQFITDATTRDFLLPASKSHFSILFVSSVGSSLILRGGGLLIIANEGVDVINKFLHRVTTLF